MVYNGRYSPFTYGQLEFLLTEMGYKQYPSTNPEWALWKNHETDTSQILPVNRQNQLAPTPDFAGIRKLSIERGIVEPEEFDALLQKAQQHATEPTHSQDAVWTLLCRLTALCVNLNLLRFMTAFRLMKTKPPNKTLRVLTATCLACYTDSALSQRRGNPNKTDLRTCYVG